MLNFLKKAWKIKTATTVLAIRLVSAWEVGEALTSFRDSLLLILITAMDLKHLCGFNWNRDKFLVKCAADVAAALSRQALLVVMLIVKLWL